MHHQVESVRSISDSNKIVPQAMPTVACIRVWELRVLLLHSLLLLHILQNLLLEEEDLRRME